jgi:predicted metal-dependent phosphoesterase TrpH
MQLERTRAESLSLPGLIFAVTDHDEVTGSLALVGENPDLAASLPVGVELSVPFEDHLFHLGITGLQPATAQAEVVALRDCCAHGDLDGVFERLGRLGCLVVLNHPLLPWRSDVSPEERAQALLSRYGDGIDALEFNGMRTLAENRGVLALARRIAKPIVGGGDSHLLVAGAAGCVSRAECFAEFVEEVRTGRTRTVVTPDYFSALGWKLTLRVLSFIAHYRSIAQFRGEPVAEILGDRRVALDPVGRIAGWFLGAAGRLGRLS